MVYSKFRHDSVQFRSVLYPLYALTWSWSRPGDSVLGLKSLRTTTSLTGCCSILSGTKENAIDKTTQFIWIVLYTGLSQGLSSMFTAVVTNPTPAGTQVPFGACSVAPRTFSINEITISLLEQSVVFISLAHYLFVNTLWLISYKKIF